MARQTRKSENRRTVRIELWPLVLTASLCLWEIPARALPVGRIKNVKPVVEAKTEKDAKWGAARKRRTLAFGDSIKTGSTGKADLLFNNGTQLAMRSNCQLRVEAPRSSDKPLVIRVFGALSEVFVRAKSNTEIRTAAGTAAVRGTQYLIQLLDDETTMVTVVEGSVNFFNPQGSVVVAANQQSRARVGEAPTPPVAVDVSGLMEWTADIVGLPVEFETPGNLTPEVQGALTDLSAGRAAEARAAVANLPNDATALAVLGLVELHSGNTAQATQALQNAVARDPRLYQAHALLALTYLSLNQLPEAEQAARRAVGLQPNSAQAQGTLAMVLFFQNRPQEATAAAGRAVKLNPLSPFALLTQGRVLLSQQNTDAALSAFQQAAALAPGLAIMQTELGAAYLRLDRPQHAEKAYRESLKLNPDSAQAHTGLGRALQAQGRTQEARSEHERALQLDPANSQAHGNLAALLIEEGRLQEAQDELEQGVKDNPERGSYYVWLSELMLYKQNLPAAQKFAQKAVRLLPKSAPAHYQLGRVYLEQERLLQAEQEFRLAVNYDRQFAAARYALGITRGKTGKGILASSGSLLTPSQVGTQGSSRTLQNLQSPGAQDRIQAAVQDPTVLRTSTRSYGDTQLDGLFGEEGTRDYALSRLQSNSDHRGVLGVTGERQETDGVRANADRTFNRYGVTYGQKAEDSPSAFFVLAEREDQEMGLDDLVAPNPFAAQVRYEYELPRLIVGRNFRKNERIQTRFLLQSSALTQRSTDGSAPDFMQRFRDGSFDGELRHDVRLGDRHLLTAGLSGGFRNRDVNSRLPAAPFPPIISDVNFRVREWQGYLRDELRANPHLTLIGEVEVQDLKYRSMSHLEIAFPPFPPLVIDTPLDNDKVLGLPNLTAFYNLDRNSEIRLRARRVAGVVQDFQLLRPTDAFFMTFDGLPQANMLEPQGNGQSYEVEYDHSFPNASLLRAGLFRQNLSDADITESSVENGPFPIARMEGARVSYEGLLNPEVSFLLRGDYTSARGVALLGSGALSDTEFLGQVPRCSGAAAVQYLNPKGFFVQSLFVYQGKRYHSADDHSTRGGFGVLNFRIGKRHGLRSSVYVGLSNVFDKQYDLFDLLQPGRQWVLGSTWRF